MSPAMPSPPIATSDTHFFHKNIVRYCDRPFATVEEMNEVMIARWNEVVGPKDCVIHLGDVVWYKPSLRNEIRSILGRLNGIKYLVPGNHDTELTLLSEFFMILDPIHPVTYQNKTVICCHYPMRSWHHNMRGVGHLFGHCHGTVPSYGKSFDVGVDAFDFYPQTWDKIWEKIDSLPLVVPKPGFRCNKCKQFPCVCPDNDNQVQEA